MTNFEIAYNLFKNLNKFEQKEIVQHFLDKMFDKPIEKDYSKNPCDEILGEKFKPNILMNSKKVCTNFFDSIEKCQALIRTENRDEVYELCALFLKSIPTFSENNCITLDEYDYLNSDVLCFDIDRHTFDFGHYTYYENDYDIIWFKDFKKLLKFE